MMTRLLITRILCILFLFAIPTLPAQAAVFVDADFESCASGSGNDFPCQGWNDFGLEFINAPGHHKTT